MAAPAGTWPLEQLFWRVAGPLVPDGASGSVMIAGRALCSMDGFELDLPATPENLAVFSCTGRQQGHQVERPERPGTAQQGTRSEGPGRRDYAGGIVPAPAVPAGDRPRRTGDARRGGGPDAAEQSLVARLVERHPGLFAGRVFLMDRNFSAIT
jgi:hypothetical protein